MTAEIVSYRKAGYSTRPHGAYDDRGHICQPPTPAHDIGGTTIREFGRRELRKVNPRGFGRVQSAMMSTKSGGGMREILERRIDQAMGRMAADLVVRNARILDLATGAIHSGDIAGSALR